MGQLDTICILLFDVFIIGSFACFNLVNIFKFAFFLYLKTLFIVFYDTVVKFNYINKNKFGQYLNIANTFNQNVRIIKSIKRERPLSVA